MKSADTRLIFDKVRRICEDTMPGIGTTDNEDTKSEEDPDDCEDNPDDCEEDQLTDPANQSDEPVIASEPDEDDEDDEADEVKETAPSNSKTADQVLTILNDLPDLGPKLARLIIFSLRLTPVEQKKLLQGCKKYL